VLFLKRNEIVYIVQHVGTCYSVHYETQLTIR